MMPWKGYAETAAYADNEKLPAGGYVLRVREIALAEPLHWSGSSAGGSIILEYDIDEGPYAGFFARNYKAQPEDRRKWKGKYRIFIPVEDGSERDEWTKRKFKSCILAFEESNRPWKWQWDENELRGKAVGGIFNNKEYEINGRHGFFTNCHSLVSANLIRQGAFTIPPDTLLKKPAGGDGYVNIPYGIGDDELPFA